MGLNKPQHNKLWCL